MTPCELCKGACCESVLLPIADDKFSIEFYKTRGTITEFYDQKFVELESKCRHLECGKCGIYKSRPEACRVYQVGSTACISTIKARRAGIADQIINLITNPEQK